MTKVNITVLVEQPPGGIPLGTPKKVTVEADIPEGYMLRREALGGSAMTATRLNGEDLEVTIKVQALPKAK